MSIPSAIPTEPYELAALLEKLPTTKWDDVRRQLLNQDHGLTDPENMFTNAADEAMNTLSCTRARAALRESLRQLGVHAADATKHLKELMEPLADIDYCEGLNAVDLEKLLADASRLVRLADALHEKILRPYESNGDTR